MEAKTKTGYNDEVVKRLNKDDFIAQHAENPHISKDDLGSYWDEIHKDDAKAPAKKAADAPAQ